MERFTDVLGEDGFVNGNYLTNSSFADEYVVREEAMSFKDKYREDILSSSQQGQPNY